MGNKNSAKATISGKPAKGAASAAVQPVSEARRPDDSQQQQLEISAAQNQVTRHSLTSRIAFKYMPE